MSVSDSNLAADDTFSLNFNLQDSDAPAAAPAGARVRQHLAALVLLAGRMHALVLFVLRPSEASPSDNIEIAGATR
jgi:hypothetical protein